MRIHKGGREGPADGLNGGEDAVLQPELEGDGGVGRHRLRDTTTLRWISGETNRISAVGNPTLCTSVVVPGGLLRAIPVSAMPKSIQKIKQNR
jgi:hypothetical protein